VSSDDSVDPKVSPLEAGGLARVSTRNDAEDEPARASEALPALPDISVTREIAHGDRRVGAIGVRCDRGSSDKPIGSRQRMNGVVG
jgi:hypothetical protein